MTGDDVYSYYDDDRNVDVAGPAVEPPRRGRLSSHLPVRFSPAVLASARQLAVEDGMSISSWIRWLVEREIMRRTPASTKPSVSDWTFEITGSPTDTCTVPAGT